MSYTEFLMAIAIIAEIVSLKFYELTESKEEYENVYIIFYYFVIFLFKNKF